MVFHRHRTTLLVFSLLKGNGNSIIVSFERDSKAINRSLLLFYFGRYSYLNQRTVRHLGLIFNLIDNVLVTSQLISVVLVAISVVLKLFRSFYIVFYIFIVFIFLIVIVHSY